LILLEEQIIDLADDKQNLDKSFKTQKQNFVNKIDLCQLHINELTENIESLEKSNVELEQKLNEKNKVNANLELRLEEIEEKVTFYA